MGHSNGGFAVKNLLTLKSSAAFNFGSDSGDVVAGVRAMRANHLMLMAGLRREIGPDGDITLAFREWYAQIRRLHQLELERAAERSASPHNQVGKVD